MQQMLSFTGYGVPNHTKDSIENYLLHGLPPGSFLEAVICGELFQAVNCADPENEKQLAEIARWFLHKAPWQALGSVSRMKDWIHDEDGRRSEYVREIEKEYVWNSLSR